MTELHDVRPRIVPQAAQSVKAANLELETPMPAAALNDLVDTLNRDYERLHTAKEDAF